MRGAGSLAMKYTLRCPECGAEYSSGFTLTCPKHDGILRSNYPEKRLILRSLPGLWRFYGWLPVEKTTDYHGKPVTYKSRGLARELGLRNLYVSFSGYCPELGAEIKTCTFKELEAPVVIQRALEGGVKNIVVSSAGNSARAFVHIGSQTGFPLVAVVPRSCVGDVWSPVVSPVVKTLVVEGDYSDADALAKKLWSMEGFTCEGGGRNVARRDALGTVLLDAVGEIGRLPEHYFQAVSSGTGGIGAWEAALRLLEDGRFGGELPRLHLSQNSPFAPMVEAWKAGRREILPQDFPPGEAVNLIYAKVLSKRSPLYGVKGGLYDALTATGGEMYAVTNAEARKAGELFEEVEGVDIVPAAAVAVASLFKAVEVGKVDAEDTVLLNVSGGGEKRVKEDVDIYPVDGIKVSKDISEKELREVLS